MAWDTESCSKPFTWPMNKSFFLAGCCACVEPHIPHATNSIPARNQFFIESLPGNHRTATRPEATGTDGLLARKAHVHADARQEIPAAHRRNSERRAAHDIAEGGRVAQIAV